MRNYGVACQLRESVVQQKSNLTSGLARPPLNFDVPANRSEQVLREIERALSARIGFNFPNRTDFPGAERAARIAS
jgi:hypothetical protein